MTNNIIIINGPNLNLLGEREQSQYGSITFDKLKNNCLDKAKELKINIDFAQSNIEGEIVTMVQEARKKYDGIIINAAGFTHTSVSIRDALEVFKKPIIETTRVPTNTSTATAPLPLETSFLNSFTSLLNSFMLS